MEEVETKLNLSGAIDLHTHTSYSDGALTPHELLEKAKATGIRLISITDHDSVSGLAEAESHAKEIGIEFVPGIEITSSYRRYQLHFLGFFFDYTNSYFISRLEDLRNGRVNRARRIIAKLNKIKIPLRLESVLEKSGVENSIGRPHIANTMVEEGYAETYDEVFNKYLGIGRPAYEANYPFPPEDAIRMVAQAGGLSFIAHPSHYVSEDVLRQLLKLGLDGIEVIHPSHSPEEVEWGGKFADDNGLLKCGGSDFHGGLKNDDANLGRYSTRDGWLESMQRKLSDRILK
jgi:3',5'-nucleoside bisphosphate phosphatase